jgi:hypothetical protein
MMRMQIANQPIPMRPYNTLPGQVPNYYDPHFANPVLRPPSQIPRPQSYMGVPPSLHSPQVWIKID